MELELRRGTASGLTAQDKHGAVICQLGERKVKLHRDLVSNVAEGEDILAGGEVRDEVLHALAVRNFTRPRVSQIDFTYYLLGLGLGGFLALLFGIFGAQGLMTGDRMAQSIDAFGSLIGIGLVLVMLTRMLRINRVANWVRRAKA